MFTENITVVKTSKNEMSHNIFDYNYFLGDYLISKGGENESNGFEHHCIAGPELSRRQLLSNEV